MTTARRLSKRETKQRLSALGIDQARGRAFAFADDATRLAYDWHRHRKHQLLYAMRGTARLESRESAFLLPPQRAAWIPAGLVHATSLNGAEVVSVYFEKSLAPQHFNRLRVFDAPPILREMILYARRWPVTRQIRDAAADAYFRALLIVVDDLIPNANAYELPRGKSSAVCRAIDWLLDDMENATLSGAAAHSGLSPRTLRRRFVSETGLHFKAFVAQARMHHAVELLSDLSHSLLDVALASGFQSQSAFTQAFRRSTGQTPREFRHKFLGPPAR